MSTLKNKIYNSMIYKWMSQELPLSIFYIVTFLRLICKSSTWMKHTFWGFNRLSSFTWKSSRFSTSVRSSNGRVKVGGIFIFLEKTTRRRTRGDEDDEREKGRAGPPCLCINIGLCVWGGYRGLGWRGKSNPPRAPRTSPAFASQMFPQTLVWVVGRGVWRARVASIDFVFLTVCALHCVGPPVCVNGERWLCRFPFQKCTYKLQSSGIFVSTHVMPLGSFRRWFVRLDFYLFICFMLFLSIFGGWSEGVLDIETKRQTYASTPPCGCTSQRRSIRVVTE